jgi:hypothetical protein
MTESGPSREALRHNAGNAATGGIWRVREARGSRILKVARPPRGETPAGSAWHTSDTPTHFNYWRREALAYESGLANSVYRDAGIRAPRLESQVTREDGAIELWLEDVVGPSGFLDCWPANLIEDSAGTSVLLDWTFVGEGAVGEDPANLIIDSVADGLMDVALLPEIADAVTTGYIKGLAYEPASAAPTSTAPSSIEIAAGGSGAAARWAR